MEFKNQIDIDRIRKTITDLRNEFNKILIFNNKTIYSFITNDFLPRLEEIHASKFFVDNDNEIENINVIISSFRNSTFERSLNDKEKKLLISLKSCVNNILRKLEEEAILILTPIAKQVSKCPVKAKVTYVKILLLTDKSNNRPVLKKSLRNSKNPLSVYDVAVYQVYTSFNEKPHFYEWQFASTEGQVDNVLQLYPFDAYTFNANPINNPGDWWHNVKNPLSDEIIFIVHFYNSFQKEFENTFTVAEDSTEELRLTIDFSAIITQPEKENNVFLEFPQAYMKKREDLSNRVPVSLDYKSSRIFSAVIKDVSRRDSLLMEWKINWDNLAAWQGSYDTSYNSDKPLNSNIPTLPGNTYQEYLIQIDNLREELTSVIHLQTSLLEYSERLSKYVDKLTNETQSKDLIGGSSVNSLVKLQINLSSNLDEYKSKEDLGNPSTEEKKKILITLTKIMEELEKISQTIKKKYRLS